MSVLAPPEKSSRGHLLAALAVLRAQHDVSEEARDERGRWTGGGGGDATGGLGPTHPLQALDRAKQIETRSFQPITADQARGNSRAVSAEEFQQLAAGGKAQMDAWAANASPITGLEQNLNTLKSDTFRAVQQDWGGATIDAHTGQPLETNADKYALSVKPVGVNSVSVDEAATRAEFNAAMDQAVERFRPQLEMQNGYLGVFRDNDYHRIDFDPVVVVDSAAQADRVGAYTHAVGGAYHFATGNGHFPPHVGEPLPVAAAAPDTSLGQPVKWKGPGQWRSFAVAVQGSETKAPFHGRGGPTTAAATFAHDVSDEAREPAGTPEGGRFAPGGGGGGGAAPGGAAPAVAPPPRVVGQGQVHLDAEACRAEIARNQAQAMANQSDEFLRTEMSSAIDGYMNGEFPALNNTLRGGPEAVASAEVTTQIHVWALQQSFSQIGSTIDGGGTTVYRGTNADDPRTFKVGTTFAEDSVLSTTTDKAIALRFEKGATTETRPGGFFEFQVPPGTKALAGVESQHELILNDHTRWTVAEMRDPTVIQKEMGLDQPPKFHAIVVPATNPAPGPPPGPGP